MAPISNLTAPLSQISAALGLPSESETAQVGMSSRLENRMPYYLIMFAS